MILNKSVMKTSDIKQSINKTEEFNFKIEKEKKEQKDKEKKDKEKIRAENTLNLKKAYNAIKPTVIQAQRILKVIESLDEKMKLIKYSEYEIIKSIYENKDLFDELSIICQKNIEKVYNIQEKFIDIKEKINLAIEEENNNSEESEPEDINTPEEEREKIKQQKIQERIEMEKKIVELTKELSVLNRNFIRILQRSNNDLKIFEEFSNNFKLNENIIQTINCINSFRFIYLKKLSTGYDEEVSHEKQLKDLKKKIEYTQSLKAEKQLELENLRKKRKEDNLLKNQEINKLDDDIKKVENIQNENLQKLREENKKNIDELKFDHNSKMNNLEKKKKDKIDEYSKLSEKNKEEEKKLRNDINAGFENLTSSIKENDKNIEDNLKLKSEKEEELKKLFNKCSDLEVKLREIKFEQKLNSKMQKKWNEKLELHEIEENKKVNAANYMIKMFQIYKLKKILKKKKRRRKNN